MEYMGEYKPIVHRGKKYCPELDWKEVRSHIKEHGMRNSNTMAIAPTATISYIQGCSPCIEPEFSVLFVYENKSGNLTIVNEWFIKECRERNIWNQAMIDAIKAVDGDLMRLNGDIPEDLRGRYCTAFDHDQFKLLECGAARQKWIDMGQSLNLFNNKTSLRYLNDLYLHAKRLGLKSTYYLRNRAASKIEKATSSSNGNHSSSGDADALDPAAQSCNVDGTCESCQ
jgi:ribonucleoside-diphosphate reductase alpha chain